MEIVSDLCTLIVLWLMCGLAGMLILLTYLSLCYGTSIRDEWNKRPQGVPIDVFILSGPVFVIVAVALIADNFHNSRQDTSD